MDRIYRVTYDGATSYAVERGGDLLGATGDPFSGLKTGDRISGGLGAVQIHAPLTPSKIVCVGLNYKDHAAERGKPLPPEPLLFLKPSTAVIGPGDPIRIPPGVGRVDHEAELGIVIGRRAHRVSRANAWDYVLGLICVNDVTARDLQKKESQYTRCKGFDTFAPIGPCIATGLNGEPRAVEGWVHDERRQS
jgi:2-keto-4-pentenoate hydratase/2-oxohepta-3-ene-1,7-dioic acid hydratase in catechol pathway